MKTKYNIGDLVWVSNIHWPKEREMGIIIGKRTGTKSLQPEYQVKFIDKTHSYKQWWSDQGMEKVKAQSKQ